MFGEPTANGLPRFVLCEVNVSSVSPFPPSSIAPLVEAVKARFAERRPRTARFGDRISERVRLPARSRALARKQGPCVGASPRAQLLPCDRGVRCFGRRDRDRAAVRPGNDAVRPGRDLLSSQGFERRIDPAHLALRRTGAFRHRSARSDAKDVVDSEMPASIWRHELRVVYRWRRRAVYCHLCLPRRAQPWSLSAIRETRCSQR